MPFTYERDDGKRRITIEVIGEFQQAEAIEMLDRHRQDGVWSYGTLYDIRRMTGRPTIDEVKQIFSSAAQPGPGNTKRGPLAVLVTDPALYSMACAYMALGAATRKIEVFREPAEAERWLGQETTSA